jgi:hypothetical protein
VAERYFECAPVLILQFLAFSLAAFFVIPAWGFLGLLLLLLFPARFICSFVVTELVLARSVLWI